MLEAELALTGGDPRRAISLLGEANGLLDTWIGRFELARAYLEAGAFAQADSELDRCFTRRGEALALFLDEEPTFGITPLLDYTQGRVREGLGTAGFADAYQRYLDRRGAAGEDALLPELRRRVSTAPAPAAAPAGPQARLESQGGEVGRAALLGSQLEPASACTPAVRQGGHHEPGKHPSSAS